MTGWYGLAAPLRAPVAIVRKLNTDANNAFKSPELAQLLRVQGLETVGGSPEEANALLKQDVARWTRLMRDAGIKP